MKPTKKQMEFEAHQHIVNALFMIENIIREKDNIDCYKFDIIKVNLEFAEDKIDYIRGKNWYTK